MGPYTFHLEIRDDPAIDELVTRTSSWSGVEVTDHGVDSEGVRRVDVASPTDLHADVEADIAGWSVEHPGLIIRPDESEHAS